VSANRFERALAAIAPTAALNRMRKRLAFQAVSGYDAAKRERAALRNFAPRGQTADADVLPGLADMRGRSRALLMNAPLACGAVNTVVTNVVGTGLRFSSQVDRDTLTERTGLTAVQAAVFERAVEREWALFCRRENCDAAGRLSFAGMQELAFSSVLASGDTFVAAVAAEAGAPFDFTLQLIEADRVCNPDNRADSDALAGGVETNGFGRPIAFHVAEMSRTGKFGGPRNWRRLDATAPDGSPRVLQLMHQRRIEQSRGVPYLAPVMAALKDLDRYTDAEMTAAVLNACIAILGESPTGASPLKAEAEASGAATGGLRRADIPFEPGTVLEGFLPGETIKSFSPDRPSSGFDPFVQAMLRQVGVALELPFELLIKHFTASYSAARAALLQAWGFFRMRRAWLAEQLCQPVVELVIANAIMRGRLDAPGFFADPILRAAYCRGRWTGPTPGQIDPLKEVNAAEKRIALRLSSRTRETAELTGEDWQDTAIEIAGEERLMEQLDIEPEPDQPAAPAPAIPEDQAAEPATNPEGADTELPEAA
jgi:lambda family phage portal protein